MAEITTFTAGVYLAAGVTSFLVTVLLMPRLIKAFRARGMVGADQNKTDKPEIAEMGGAGVVIGFFAGVVTLMLVGYAVPATIIPNPTLLLAALVACLGAAFIGAVDDSLGMSKRVKAIAPVLFAIPLALYLGDTTVYFTRGFAVDLGILMIPTLAFMVSAGANSANMLEGFNGLGSGLGLLMGGAFVLIAVYAGRPEVLILLAPFLGATAAFYLFNRFPAKVFPGDTFTLFMGATLVVSAIVVDLKEAGALLFIPMIAEFFLKLRTRFKIPCYGTPQPDGTLTYSGPTGSLTHVAMKAGAKTEKGVVRAIWGMELAVILLMMAFLLV